MVLSKRSRPQRGLTPEQVRTRVHHILHGHGVVIYTGHVKERMLQRDFSTQDIQHILETGTYSEGHWEPAERNYEANVSGWDTDGEELEVSLALDEGRSRLFIVTGKRPQA